MLNTMDIDINSESIVMTRNQDINKKEGKPIIISAIEYGNLEIFQLLLSNKNLDLSRKYIKSFSSKNKFGEEYDLIKSALQNKEILKILFDNLIEHNPNLIPKDLNVYIGMVNDNEAKDVIFAAMDRIDYN